MCRFNAYNSSMITREKFTFGFKKYPPLGTWIKIELSEVMFTLYRIVKRSVEESVPDRASVHTRSAVFEAVSAMEQCCSAPLLKVERSVSDRFLQRSESGLNTFIGVEVATKSRFGK